MGRTSFVDEIHNLLFPTTSPKRKLKVGIERPCECNHDRLEVRRLFSDCASGFRLLHTPSPVPMADERLKVIDGTVLRATVSRLPIPGGAVTGADLLQLADDEASSALFGLSLPERLKSAALRRMDADAVGFPSTKYSQEEASLVLLNYVTAIADELTEDPLVVSVLDGTALQLILDDEDDFAVLAENLFTDLDTEDTGKLSKNKIKNALDLMGVDMGVPPHSGSSDLLTGILKKHGVDGKKELGQAQFAHLLQLVLQDLADVLAEFEKENGTESTITRQGSLADWEVGTPERKAAQTEVA